MEVLEVLLIVLAIWWLWSCVYCLGGKRSLAHRIGRMIMGALAGVLAVWLGGGWLLGWFGLAWRSRVNTVFLVLVVVAALAVPVCTTVGLEERQWSLFPVVCILCAGGVLAGAFVGMFMAVFSYSPERDLTWEGVSVVEEDHSFLDPTFAYYRTLGPLFKEKEDFYYTHEESQRLCPEELETPGS